MVYDIILLFNKNNKIIIRVSKTSWRFYRKNLYCFLANSKYSTFSLSKFVPGRREQQPEQLKIQQQQTIQTTNSSFFFCFFCFCFFLFFLSFLPGVVSTRHNNSYMTWCDLSYFFVSLSFRVPCARTKQLRALVPVCACSASITVYQVPGTYFLPTAFIAAPHHCCTIPTSVSQLLVHSAHTSVFEGRSGV